MLTQAREAKLIKMKTLKQPVITQNKQTKTSDDTKPKKKYKRHSIRKKLALINKYPNKPAKHNGETNFEKQNNTQPINKKGEYQVNTKCTSLIRIIQRKTK